MKKLSLLVVAVLFVSACDFSISTPALTTPVSPSSSTLVPPQDFAAPTSPLFPPPSSPSTTAPAQLIVPPTSSPFPVPLTFSFDKQLKSPHFVDSTPLHEEIYAAQPINITINFNFDVAVGSKISVTSTDNKEWTDGNVVIEDNNTVLKFALKSGMLDGLYKVTYYACWPDKSCHDGEFSFAIDSSKKTVYTDMRNQTSVTVSMKDFNFEPRQIIISPGTKVTWSNEGSFGHFVNTETHPEHTYFPEQNSREVASGESFSTTFQIPGQYNYHCSAHVPQNMLGSIVVVN